jgi:hypothetical protein
LDVNYIILAHKNPEQLKRLISRLNTSWTYFYIHIDSNSKIEPFEEILCEFQNIYLLKDKEREKGIWGDIGIVKATIKALEKIVQHKRKGYCVLLSGQDYPLQNNIKIQSYFSNNDERAFITAYPLPHSNLDQGGLPRINNYKINKSNKRGHFMFLNSIFDSEFYNLKTLGKLNYLRKTGKWKDILKILKKRKFPAYLVPYSGSQWWALNIDYIHKILKFIQENPSYLKYHYDSLLPDEMFFQSIIFYYEKFEPKGISKSLTYVNWERPNGPLPVTFTKKDLTELKLASKNYLFARKFDMEMDTDILNLIDSELLK